VEAGRSAGNGADAQEASAAANTTRVFVVPLPEPDARASTASGGASFALVKVRGGYHARTLQMLATERAGDNGAMVTTIAPGQPVQIVWASAPSGDGANRASTAPAVISVAARISGQNTPAAAAPPQTAEPQKAKPDGPADGAAPSGEGSADSSDEPRFSLAPAPGGASSFSPAPPPGAVVVDPQSGLAIGIVRGEDGSASPSFATFRNLYTVSNEVALLPDARAKAPAPDQEPAPGTEKDGMVWVPSGSWTLTMGSPLASDYARRFHTSVACTPGFWIDRGEVTNEVYQTFLREPTQQRRPVPRGWHPNERDQLARTSNLPVTGVTPGDASDCAAFLNKRLITPIEWNKASRGAGGRWLAVYQGECRFRMNGDEKGAGFKWSIVGLAHEEAQQVLTDYIPQRSLSVDPATGQVVELPSAYWPSYARRAWPAACLDALHRYSGEAAVLAPSGARVLDESIYGVRHLVTNASEHLLFRRSQARAGELVIKVLPPLYDPDKTPHWKDVLLEYARRRTAEIQMFVWGGPSVTNAKALANAANFRTSGRRLPPGLLFPLPGADPAADEAAREALGVSFRCAR
jgi:hypothetical protein